LGRRNQGEERRGKPGNINCWPGPISHSHEAGTSNKMVARELEKSECHAHSSLGPTRRPPHRRYRPLRKRNSTAGPRTPARVARRWRLDSTWSQPRSPVKIDRGPPATTKPPNRLETLQVGSRAPSADWRAWMDRSTPVARRGAAGLAPGSAPSKDVYRELATWRASAPREWRSPQIGLVRWWTWRLRGGSDQPLHDAESRARSNCGSKLCDIQLMPAIPLFELSSEAC